jgi:2C-methyl-D-erythritol 2,4-cyclodiphosphate synthase
MVRTTNVIEKSFMSSNVILLALFYTVFGACLSYVMYHIFDEFDEHWKKRTTVFQLTDVTLEISILATIAFWSSQIINYAPPMLPVRKELDSLVDTSLKASNSEGDIPSSAAFSQKPCLNACIFSAFI